MSVPRTDHELMADIARGDEGAFREIVERHQREVYGTIAKMLGDPHEAEDLAQRVFLRVYQAAPRYRPEAQFNTWLFTILRRLVFNESHRRARLQARQVQVRETPGPDGEGRDLGNDAPDLRQPDPSRQLAERERWERIDAALLELPENQRLALLLKAHQDLSYEEIARVLKTSVSATKSILFRARETLKERLPDEFRSAG
jgi:RNA polymerase sigma-70 factor, ECF subfamily